MPEWFTPKEAAKYLKVSRMTIYRWCADGTLRYHELPKVGRRFTREDLDAVLRRGQPK